MRLDFPPAAPLLRFLPIDAGGSASEAVNRLSLPLFLCRRGTDLTAFHQGQLLPGDSAEGLPLDGFAPPMAPQRLGSASFRDGLGLRYAYVAGSMAKGISSVDLVCALAEEGMLAFFGAGGLPPLQVAEAIRQLQQRLERHCWGINLIHSPLEPALEAATVEVLLQQQVRLVEAAAFLDLTLPLVRYRTSGIHRDGDGRIQVPNRIIAKVSREEVATHFCAPPPERLLRLLVEQRALTVEQAELAATIPMADAVTAEADSGGHTDNRPLSAVFPTVVAVRDRAVAQFNFQRPIHVGAAGGIGTPSAAAAAFAMGADYIVTGSVNQACVEAGTSDAVRQLLADTRQADVTMAPAADMFEMGGRVQVIKRGTLFAMRAAKLYELYREYPSVEAIPATEREKLERTIFRQPIAAVWQQTQDYFRRQDPEQLVRAEKDAKHRLALLCRWYLGSSPEWARQGLADRVADYQIWCGPAMGAFNEWVRGSFMAAPAERRVALVAHNLLFGAARLLRLQALRCQSALPSDVSLQAPPLRRNQIEEYQH